jgi:hypothetical protein
MRPVRTKEGMMSRSVTAKPTARPVRFFTKAEGARDVRVTGVFSGWSRAGVRLSHDGNGIWRAMLSLNPGSYEYRLLINGAWADHEEATDRVGNPFGTRNCVLTVP